MAAAHSLAKRGQQVTVLDVGIDIDEHSARLRDQFQSDNNQEQLLREIHRLRSQHATISADQPGKYLFGSDYPYRTLPETTVQSGTDAVVRSSLGKGGLSAVWGATVSTVVPKDIGDWPISFDDLKPHYQSLEEFISVASPSGEMRGVFPMDIGADPSFDLGQQGKRLLDQLQSHSDLLLADGIHHGRAKVAVGPKHSLDGKGCTPCGLCMHGCPNQAIFNAAYVLDKLLQQPNFHYQQGVLVESFAEKGDRVIVTGKHVASDERQTWSFDRVLIASGVINSTAIVARSLNLTNHTFTIKDSQKYIFPILTKKRARGAMHSADNTLAQVFLTVDNPMISDHAVQVQYYGYNDIVLDPIRSRLGASATRVFSHMAAPLLERLVIAFVYLHSNDSGTLSMRVHEQDRPDGLMAEISGTANPRSDAVVGSLFKLLHKHRKAHGGRAIRRGMRATKPGDSQHIGGTLPMSSSPSNYETDILGRPGSLRRVHVIDASIMPTVPGTPIAYTAMANATRIAAATGSI
jgi:choline dehydrogenase-like flavoprotein